MPRAAGGSKLIRFHVMLIFARHSLVQSCGDAPALLLEGDWPAEEPQQHERHSLDASIDARHGWIDEAALELSVRLSEAEHSLAGVNALALRYYLVKLLRPIAWFDENAIEEPVSLHAEAERDEDYVDICSQICQARGVRVDLHFHAQQQSKRRGGPRNGVVRYAASRLNGLLTRGLSGIQRDELRPPQAAPRVLFCGNPHVLNLVCRELLARGGAAAWLYDRFAFGAWLRWQPRGVRQFTCDSGRAGIRRFDESIPRIEFRGIDLTPSLARWFHHVAGERGAAQTRMIEKIEEHLEAWQPAALVLDEDATPLKRIAIGAARRRGIASFVVQHGAPRVRFGFAPLSADRFLAWGASSADQLAGWGVPREKIVVAGAVRFEQPKQPSPPRPSGEERILLFATTPPSDSRPDAVQYHLTARTHDESLRIALAAVAGLPRAHLTIKVHPRCSDVRRFQQIVANFPGLRCRITRRGSVASLIANADAVLNCGSSAGIEAAQQGVPVIELLPEGSRDLTPAARWGQFGSAYTFEELCRLLDQALRPGFRCQPPCSEVFVRTGQAAARAVVDTLLESRDHENSSALAAQEAR